MSKRVVVTGMSGVTSLGCCWKDIAENMNLGVSGVQYMSEWEQIKDLNSRIAAPVLQLDLPHRFGRKQLRGAGRVAQLALAASEAALQDARLLDADVLSSADTGVAYGSSAGSVNAVAELGMMIYSNSTSSLNATSYIRMMPHTTAVNVSVVYRTQGRIYPTSCACVSGSLAIGYSYEAIKHGYQRVMLAGGADELDATVAAVFDTLYATSQKNDAPQNTPRPFDKYRDGLVVGEGAATLVLEELEHARARNAPIYAEVVGFATNSDGNHLTQPTQTTMETVIRAALDNAQLSPADIGYVSAHATGTLFGDAAESLAVAAILGVKTPMSSLKGYFGHTLGACGAIEAWLGITGMNEGWFPASHNLAEIAPDCATMDYIIGAPREIQCEAMMSNNFAFGGMNTSLIFKKYRA